MHVQTGVVLCFITIITGCGSPGASKPDAGKEVVVTTDPQLPPSSNAADVETWLAGGYYKSWQCESEKHPARSPSPHGINRICNNAKLMAQPAGPGEYPVGAAAVKELYDADGQTIAGYAVEVHVSAGKSTSNWYWYERNPSLGAPAKNGNPGLIADGIGPNEGTAGTGTEALCTGCHAAAGADAAHNTTDSHDFVYTHVP